MHLLAVVACAVGVVCGTQGSLRHVSDVARLHCSTSRPFQLHTIRPRSPRVVASTSYMRWMAEQQLQSSAAPARVMLA